MIQQRKKICIVAFISFLMLIWSQREILFISTGVGYRIVELVFTICMLIVMTVTAWYLLIEDSPDISKKTLRGYYLKLLLIQTVAFLPFYTQKFMYGDDLWGFSSDFSGDISQGLYFSRPFIDFLLGPLTDTSFLSINIFRIYNAIILFIFGCILFRFMTEHLKSVHMAFGFSAIAISSCIAVDCIAYASIYPINSSLLMSAISFVVFTKAKECNKEKKIIFMLISGVCLFTAFCMYQIGTPIVFLLYMIYERQKREESGKKRFGRAFAFLIYYGSVAIMYLLGTKAFQFITGVSEGQKSRGEIVLSVEGIWEKAVWFITEVIPQSLSRMIAVIFGNGLYNENNMFYKCTYKNEIVAVVVVVVLVVLILISIGKNSIGQKSFVYLLLSIAAIPLSFWPFLILPESVFLTYYALGTILLLAWYICDGISILIAYGEHKFSSVQKVPSNWKGTILSIFLIIAVLQSNYYAENAWVNYSRDSYEYLANTIAAQLEKEPDIEVIAVQGSLSPYVGGRDYVIFCVEDILTELGYDPDTFKIVQSYNEYYVISFNESEVEEMEEILGPENMDKLYQYYYHNELYSLWSYNGTANDEESLDFLQECFTKTRQLILDGDDMIVISMDGFNSRNRF